MAQLCVECVEKVAYELKVKPKETVHVGHPKVTPGKLCLFFKCTHHLPMT